ncbi:BON domain-containing protein [Silvibacterium acidisoli]|uniref:BON domain-containing protein n=1 Tax=Acidobacteriaceae bacterium ZG23-2 TaxID=2883246 RepID=UPI00406D1A66
MSRVLAGSKASRNVSRVTLAVLMAASLGFYGTPSAMAQNGNQQAAARTDADIQSDVNHALMQDATLRGQKITVTTQQGTVTLTGRVQTNAQRQQVETLAANVNGITGIANNLTVADPNSPVPPPSSGPSQLDQANNADQGNGQDEAQNQNQPQAQQNGENPPPPPPDQESQQPQQGGYSQQGGYRMGYNGGQEQGYNAPPQAPPSGPITLPAGTLVRVRLSEQLDTAKTKDGTYFQATAAADVYQGGVLAIPRGATLTGVVVKSKSAGDLGGSAIMELQITNVNLEGKIFPVQSDIWSSKGPNKAGYTTSNTVGGAAVGALIGGILGRGAGAAIGAGVGGAAGLAASSATKGPRLILPVESTVDFHLLNPVTVQPVSWQEAQRLASNVPQQPQLQRRPMYVVPRPYPYPYYGYPYPYPY